MNGMSLIFLFTTLCSLKKWLFPPLVVDTTSYAADLLFSPTSSFLCYHALLLHAVLVSGGNYICLSRGNDAKR